MRDRFFSHKRQVFDFVERSKTPSSEANFHHSWRLVSLVTFNHVVSLSHEDAYDFMILYLHISVTERSLVRIYFTLHTKGDLRLGDEKTLI